MVVTELPRQRTGSDGRHDWWKAAACRDADPELFFPVSSLGPGAIAVAEAKAVCAGCVVRRQCLQFALATRQMHGVWGGTTEDERQIGIRASRESRRDGSGGAGRRERETSLRGGARAVLHK